MSFLMVYEGTYDNNIFWRTIRLSKKNVLVRCVEHCIIHYVIPVTKGKTFLTWTPPAHTSFFRLPFSFSSPIQVTAVWIFCFLTSLLSFLFYFLSKLSPWSQLYKEYKTRYVLLLLVFLSTLSQSLSLSYKFDLIVCFSVLMNIPNDEKNCIISLATPVWSVSTASVKSGMKYA